MTCPNGVWTSAWQVRIMPTWPDPDGEPVYPSRDYPWWDWFWERRYTTPDGTTRAVAIVGLNPGGRRTRIDCHDNGKPISRTLSEITAANDKTRQEIT